MKYLKNVLVVASLAVSSLLFTSFSANAVLITQNIYIDIDTADAGNAWGISLADSGLFGTIQYDPTKVVGGGIITPEDDPSYSFSLALGGLALSMFDDVDFGFGGPIALTDPLNAFAGIQGLLFNFDNGVEFASIVFDYFDAFDGQFNEVSGVLIFGDTTLVPEPSMLLLVLGGLAFVARRRFVA
jgi:hypothetical protein